MLTSTVEVLECKERESYVVENVWGFLFTHSHMHKFIGPEVHFDAESIGASPVKITCKTAKLFTFLQGPTQCEHTIV